MTKITVVNEKDEVIGAEERKIAREKGLIHRVIRILVFNSQGEIFLQKRSQEKEAWPNRWDQSVGGHVEEGEDYLQAALRELKEELGISGVKLEEIEKYYTEGDYNGLTIKRFNMPYQTTYNGEVNFNKNEISESGWFQLDYVENWMKEKPNDFTRGCIETLKRCFLEHPHSHKIEKCNT